MIFNEKRYNKLCKEWSEHLSNQNRSTEALKCFVGKNRRLDEWPYVIFSHLVKTGWKDTSLLSYLAFTMYQYVKVDQNSFLFLFASPTPIDYGVQLNVMCCGNLDPSIDVLPFFEVAVGEFFVSALASDVEVVREEALNCITRCKNMSFLPEHNQQIEFFAQRACREIERSHDPDLARHCLNSIIRFRSLQPKTHRALNIDSALRVFQGECGFDRDLFKHVEQVLYNLMKPRESVIKTT